MADRIFLYPYKPITCKDLNFISPQRVSGKYKLYVKKKSLLARVCLKTKDLIAEYIDSFNCVLKLITIKAYASSVVVIPACF